MLIFAAFSLGAAHAQPSNLPAPTVVDKDGFTPLFTGRNSAGWKVEDGVLESGTGTGNLWTKKRYGDFILELDFKVRKRANSGVFIRTDEPVAWSNTGFEVQLLDSTPKATLDSHDCGAIYDIAAPTKNAANPAGQWNHCRVTAKGPKISVEFNGQLVNDINLNDWKTANKNPDGSSNRLSSAGKDMKREGYIGLQDHGDAVWFRNIRVKELKDAAK